MKLTLLLFRTSFPPKFLDNYPLHRSGQRGGLGHENKETVNVRVT